MICILELNLNEAIKLWPSFLFFSTHQFYFPDPPFCLYIITNILFELSSHNNKNTPSKRQWDKRLWRYGYLFTVV